MENVFELCTGIEITSAMIAKVATIRFANKRDALTWRTRVHSTYTYVYVCALCERIPYSLQ